MFTKWVIDIDGLSNYRVSQEGDIYRMPFVKDGKSYEWRLIKEQYPSRWVLNGQKWSKSQLRPHLIEDPDPIEIYKINDRPF